MFLKISRILGSRCMRSYGRCIAVLILTVGLSSHQADAQFKIGIFAGPNISKAHGSAFRSINRMGLQFGAGLTYHFTPLFGLQAEPAYNITRVRTNDHTAHLEQGMSKGNRALNYFALPVLAKISFARQFAVLGGIAFNILTTTEQYRLNDGQLAFERNPTQGYIAGLEVGKLYFRYQYFSGFNQIIHNREAHVQQFQLGLRWSLL